MSRRNYLNVVSAGVVAFGTLALGLVSVLPMAGAANADKEFSLSDTVCPKGETFNGSFCTKSEAKPKAKPEAKPEAKDDMAQLADLEKAGTEAEKSVKAYDTAKENLAKFAESKKLNPVAKQVRDDKKSDFAALAKLVREALPKTQADAKVLAELAGLEKAGTDAKANADEILKESWSNIGQGEEADTTDYDKANDGVKTAKENLAKFAEGKKLAVAKQVRDDKKSDFAALAKLVREALPKTQADAKVLAELAGLEKTGTDAEKTHADSVKAYDTAKENLAKFAEGKKLNLVAKRVRNDKNSTFATLANLVREGLKAAAAMPAPTPVDPTPAPVNPTPADSSDDHLLDYPEFTDDDNELNAYPSLTKEEQGKKTPETPAKKNAETPVVTPESKTQPSAGKDASKDAPKGQQQVKKGHHKFGAPNTGYEF